jgi:hypothetical protein
VRFRMGSPAIMERIVPELGIQAAAGRVKSSLHGRVRFQSRPMKAAHVFPLNSSCHLLAKHGFPMVNSCFYNKEILLWYIVICTTLKVLWPRQEADCSK